MSKTFAVFKREFTEQVRTKTFIIGTLFGPVAILALMFLPYLFLKAGGGGERNVVIVDATGTGLGEEVSGILAVPILANSNADMPVGPGVYHTTVRSIDAAAWETMRPTLDADLEAETIDGYMYLPPDVEGDGEALYIGKTIGMVTQAEVRRAVQTPIQRRRLAQAGIDQAVVAQAMRPVSVITRQPGDDESATPESLFVFAQIIAFSIYIVVILYGQAVLRGVMEEKRDKIVEVVLSSMRASRLMLGKIFGIGSAGLLQMAIWTAFGIIAMTWGADMLRARGVEVGGALPDLGPMVAVAFLIFFFGGFLFYSSLFAAVGAVATTDQEAQQLSFIPMLPLVIGFMTMFSGLADPENPVFRVCSIVPFTSPMVMPVRAAMSDVPMVEFGLSVALLILTVGATTWVAGKIYSIGILATGKRPSMGEIVRWIRTA